MGLPIVPGIQEGIQANKSLYSSSGSLAIRSGGSWPTFKQKSSDTFRDGVEVTRGHYNSDENRIKENGELNQLRIQLPCLLLSMSVLACVCSKQSAAHTSSSTSCHISFQVDVSGAIGCSDFIPGRPNFAAAEAMPLGNDWLAGKNCYGHPGENHKGDSFTAGRRSHRVSNGRRIPSHC